MLASSGCRVQPQATGSIATNRDDPRIRIALEGLNGFGRGIFDVVEATTGSIQETPMRDGQNYTRQIDMVEVHATIRYVRDLTVPTREEIRARVGDPGWTLEGSLADIDHLLVLGAGEHKQGSQQSLDVQAALRRTAAGPEFHTLEPMGPRQ